MNPTSKFEKEFENGIQEKKIIRFTTKRFALRVYLLSCCFNTSTYAVTIL